MSDSGDQLGKISKMKFVAYKDDTFEESKSLKKEFTVQFNPKTLGVDYSVTYEENQGSSSKVKFAKAKPGDLNIEFTLDGTGIDSKDASKVTKVDERIADFLDMCKETDSKTHEPPFILISYGKLIYKTRFKSCNITYTLFKADGTPLRAVVKAIFLNIKNNVTDEREKSLNSPDVTHRRNIEAHQSLIQISNEIYERNDLYIEVARANNLNTFRKAALPQNYTLYFPPIKK